MIAEREKESYLNNFSTATRVIINNKVRAVQLPPFSIFIKQQVPSRYNIPEKLTRWSELDNRLIILHAVFSCQFLMECPTPGLWPGAVGRKSLTYLTLLALAWRDSVIPTPPFATALKVFLTTSCFDNFLRFKCLLPSADTNWWHKIKTRKNAQAHITQLLLAILILKKKRRKLIKLSL